MLLNIVCGEVDEIICEFVGVFSIFEVNVVEEFDSFGCGVIKDV